MEVHSGHLRTAESLACYSKKFLVFFGETMLPGVLVFHEFKHLTDCGRIYYLLCFPVENETKLAVTISWDDFPCHDVVAAGSQSVVFQGVFPQGSILTGF